MPLSAQKGPQIIKTTESYDAIIIGSGATGCWAAKELSDHGLNILVLEAGGEVLTPAELVGSSFSTIFKYAYRFLSNRQKIQRKHPIYWLTNPDYWVDDLDNPYSTPFDQPFHWIRGRQVGGRTLLWGGITLRLSDDEFQAAHRDGYGENWPICYQDLAPYYDRVEGFLGVCGSYEGIPHFPDGKFLPPMQMSSAEKQIKLMIEKTWPDRHMVMNRGIPIEPLAALKKQNQMPQWTAQGSTLSHALRSGRVCLKYNSIVSQITLDKNTGKAKSVVVVDRLTKATEEIKGRIILLCGSTIETIRLLLNSANLEHPYGLGNSSGTLGHFLMDHVGVYISADITRFKKENPVLSSYGPNSFCIPKFRNLSDGRENSNEFYRGYGIHGWAGRSDRNIMEAVGRLLRERSFRNAPHLDLLAYGEMLSRFENRVEIDKNLKDAWGIPAVRIHAKWSDNEIKMAEDMNEVLREIVHVVKGTITYPLKNEENISIPGQFVHEVGGARMGNDPKSSVLNSFNQCWDISNIFVTDGACWVTSGWQNPTLTMMAITVRACDFIARELKNGNL